ncbi:Protein COFACTOR ASSEMBLY OF COMPLEX C SUBUNIT B ccb3, chloroplastic [Turnera subulata]|uniref:Protein COFACTOR ASSEMBLY OF COMPLEX C SUBUNIT B ccb3, chloroplastic n=1 Tax=Turnera subulata TaxID=218843 RepID=A0A9Q0G429_9ROSI|nr:Protein COFACTOR ASSEMBLY OF COMPLEX C SUBUNIT B ccb3, chloroplastic [Turnera subulata]
MLWQDRLNGVTGGNPSRGHQAIRSKTCCFVRVTASLDIELSPIGVGGVLSGRASNAFEVARNINLHICKAPEATSLSIQGLMLADLDPATAKIAIGFLGPFLSAFAFLFVLRIVMSWYPRLPVGKFPYVIAYAPTEPLLIPTRKLIPPLGGVDVTPVVWFGLVSFLNEILVGPQGLLVLLSQQVN